jgi:hypothetical protein
MAKRVVKRGNALEKWEVAIIKAMLERGGYTDQDILAHFTRPTRSINHSRILEIRKEKKHKAIKAASKEELDDYLAAWPDIDPETGLSRRGDELLIKSREAMIAAVHMFNGAGLTFRAELFIVTCIIAWTYLLHAWFKREGIDYRYKNADGSIKKTKQGADCYWELGKCLDHPKCPVKGGAATNLEFLLDLRHEIEHRSTDRLDEQTGAKLQACCINFNEAMKGLFGAHFGLERRLPLALQFASFNVEQRELLKRNPSLPAHIETFIDAFEHGLTPEQIADPAYRYVVAFVPMVSGKASKADMAVEFVKADSDEAREVNRVLLKEVDRPRYTASEVVQKMKSEGYPGFSLHAHTTLWQELDAKKPGLGYGKQGDYANTWVWYDRWLERVRAHCQEKGDLYK